MLNKPHFRNGLACGTMHTHGASCAVDVLLDIFYFAIYDKTNGFGVPTCDTGMVKRIHAMCQFRDVFGSASCELREEIWNWLVGNLPNAYAPKGRGDAEVVAGFTAFAESAKSIVDINTVSTCCVCDRDICNAAAIAVITVGSTSTEKCAGDLAKAVEMEVNTHIRNCQILKCSTHSDADVIEKYVDVSWPNILLVELGIVDHRNRQDPPVRVDECMTVGHTVYELKASVQVQPGHFYGIIRHGEQYAVVDGLKTTVSYFDTFSAAVQQSNVPTMRVHYTSTNHDAIHILVYQKILQNIENSSTHTNDCQEVSSVENKDSDGQHGKPETTNSTVPSGLTNTACESVEGEPIPVTEKGALVTRTDIGNTTMGTGHKADHTITTDAEVPVIFRHTYRNHPVHIDNVEDIDLGACVVKCVSESGSRFVSCEQTFRGAGMEMHVSKNGYTCIDSVLQRAGHERYNCFIFEGNHRCYVRIDAVLSLLKSKIGNQESKVQMITQLQKLCPMEMETTPHRKDTSCDLYDTRVKQMEEELKAEGVTVCTGHVLLSTGRVRYATKQGTMYVCCTDMFEISGLIQHVRKIGYASLDKKLGKLGFQDAFIVYKHTRLLIQLTALLELLNSGLNKHKNADAFNGIRKELISVLQTETCMDISQRRRTTTPKKDKLKTPVSVNKSPSWKRRRNRALFHPMRKSRGFSNRTQQLQSAMQHAFDQLFKSRDELKHAFAKLITTDKIDTSDDEFDGTFTTNYLAQILKVVSYKKSTVRPKCATALDHMISQNVNFSVHDLVHLQENFSGTRLMDQLRQRLGAILPSKKEEYELKTTYNSQFKAILLPERTSTGWCIDPGRLLEVLSFKYWWLQGEQHWKIYGDGREIGGRQSCFIAVSTLNNEARLHGISHQSSKEIFPIQLFYESDSRDNLEENLGFPSKLNVFLEQRQRDGNTFYLSGDEMFLEAMLAADGLGPLTKDGWNIYRSDNVEQKKEVSPHTGLRADLNLDINREHAHAILCAISTPRVVLCILHAFARCVEKFLNLEVDNILSDANKAGERGDDSSAYIDDKIHTLENNINKRGVRGGNFRIHFNSKGAPEHVSLNKTHAMVIVSRPPVGQESDYPHVMTHILDRDKLILNPIREDVKQKLMLPDTYTEFDLVTCIWDHFTSMMDILQKDPAPERRPGREEGSTRTEDYDWGYNQTDRSKYIHHAESFYQLYVWRYTYKALTPYMMKLIDIVPILMESLPFPLARFQSEGGEHVNYEHNRFYFQHTTRHGGRGHTDPLLDLFRNMFKKLVYTIGQSGSPQDIDARTCFDKYCRQHEAAATIQRCFRLFLQRRKVHITSNVIDASPEDSSQNRILSGFVIVMCGNVPKQGSKKYTQSSFKTLLHEHGARVRTKLPGQGKGNSTKKYTVLATSAMLQHSKIVGPIRQAVRKGFDVLKYEFITDSIETGKLADPADYKISVSKLAATVTKDRSLNDRHFSREISMLSKLRKQRKNAHTRQKRARNTKPIRSAALHYVITKRNQLQKGKSVSFRQSNKNLQMLFKKWRLLSPTEKANATVEWQNENTKRISEYNQLNSSTEQSDPAYRGFFIRNWKYNE